MVCYGIRAKQYCLSAQLQSVVVQDKVAVLDIMKGKGCRLQHAQSDVPYQAALAVMTNCFGMFFAALLCVVLQSRPWGRDFLHRLSILVSCDCLLQSIVAGDWSAHLGCFVRTALRHCHLREGIRECGL